jgi:thioredoxin
MERQAPPEYVNLSNSAWKRVTFQNLRVYSSDDREDAMGAALHTTDSNFKKDVLDSNVPVLVDFWAEWCGPCRMVAPVLDELAKEYEGKIRIAKVNVDENQQVSMDFHIRSIPTLLFFKNGQMVKQLVGAHPKAKLVSEIQEVIGV